jgi:hypothetical protein
MAFGVLYDFNANLNATGVIKVIKAATMVKQQWFKDVVNFPEPIDMFLVLGHNPAGRPGTGSTFPKIFEAIRAIKPETPITLFGGHLHRRDTIVYDDKAVCIASGKYDNCETE